MEVQLLDSYQTSEEGLALCDVGVQDVAAGLIVGVDWDYSKEK